MVNNQRQALLKAKVEQAQHDLKVAQVRLEELMQLQLLHARYPDVFELTPIKRAANTLNARLARSKKAQTKRDAILNACEEILADGKRRFARALLPELEKRSVKVSGRNEDIQKTNLAAYLSHSDKFEANNKLGGWTLRNLSTPKTKAGNGQTLPAFPTHGALLERPPTAGMSR